MRFLHLGDLHLGKSVNDYSMIEDQRYILKQILNIADEKKVDAILIAGDIYDKSIPSEEAVSLLNEFIWHLADRKLPTYLITGNHDSDERLNFGSSLFESNGIHIAAKYDGRLSCYELEDEYGPLQIHLLPFVKASTVRHYYPEDKIENYDDAIRLALQHVDGVETGRVTDRGVTNEADEGNSIRKVLVAHQFVIGSAKNPVDPVPGGSENIATLNVGTVEKVDVSCFDGYDYVALGHIHSPQKVGRETVRYCGSPLKYSLSEIATQKSVPIISLKEKNHVEIECVPLLPRREMRHIKGKIDQLLDPDHIVDPDDYIYVSLTDEITVMDAMARVRHFYPNTMRLDYDNAHTKGFETADFTDVTKGQTFEELMEAFYASVYQKDISKEEMTILQDVAREAGVLYDHE